MLIRVYTCRIHNVSRSISRVVALQKHPQWLIESNLFVSELPLENI